jgi:hypothetical protein
VKALLALLMVGLTGCISVAVSAEEKAAEDRVRVGILNLEKYNKAEEIADKAQYDLITLFKEVGFYECFDQAAIEKTMESVEKKMPPHCRDPKCVLEVGKTIGMDRMVFGEIEWGNNRCGIKLAMMDVPSRQTIEKVNLQGAAGVPVADVLKASVAKLHGREIDETNLEAYFGPTVHNEKQLLISTAACLGVGLLYGIINYGVEQDVTRLSADYQDEPLSGIATTGVPLFARPAALANAYVAVSDDAYGVMYNPAGMAWVAGPEAVLAYQYRFGLDNIAASYVNKATREIGFGQGLLYQADREHLMTELYFISSVAYKFNNMPGILRPVSLGANVKILSNRVKSTSDISSGGSSLGVGLDLGLMWELSEVIRYGLLFRDVPVVNYWKNVKTDERYFEPHPATLLMGGAFQAGYSTFLVAEGHIPLYKDQPWRMAGGIEQEFFNLFKLRVGIQREIMALYETPWKFTGGFGFTVNSEKLAGKYVSLDGSYEYNTLQVFDVINVSLRYGF